MPDGASFRIFLNYRRTDADPTVGRLWDTLTNGIGGEPGFAPEQIFKDIDTIEPGVDFRDAIREAVESSDVFLAVIGRDWLNVVDARGRRRLDNPADFVRLEITAALRRAAEHQDVRVVPTLVQGAQMPDVEELPDALSELAHRNAVELTDARWPYDAGRLFARLKALEQEKLERVRRRVDVPEADAPAIRPSSVRGAAVRPPAGRLSPRPRRARRLWVLLGIGILAVGVAVAANVFLPSDGPGDVAQPQPQPQPQPPGPGPEAAWTASAAPGVEALFGATTEPGGATTAVGKAGGLPMVIVSVEAGPRLEPVEPGSGTMRAVASSGQAVVAGGFVHDTGTDVDGKIWKRTGGTWRRVCLDRVCGDGPSGGLGRQEVNALAVTASGSFVGAGLDTAGDGHRDAAVWFSADGSDWARRAADDDDLGGSGDQVIHGLARVGDRLLAVGRSARNGAVWWSEDEGRSWTRAGDVPSAAPGEYVTLKGVAASSGPAIVAVGFTQVGGASVAAAWVSTDRGSTWKAAEIANAAPRGQQMRSVVRVPAGWVAVGEDHPGEGGSAVAAVWRAPAGGERWTAVRGDSFDSGGERSMDAVTPLADGRVVAVGTGKDAGARSGRIWISAPAG